MRRLLPLALLLAACDRGPENTPPPPPAAVLPPASAAPEPGADPGQTTRSAPADALIAFARGRELWVVRPDGSAARRVIAMDADVAQPAWSPNRRWIAFSSTAGADRNLYRRNLFLVRPDGSDVRQVTPLPRAADDLEHAPKGLVRGRAVALTDAGRLGVADFDVAVAGRSTRGRTTEAGLFELHAPIGATWVKVSGTFKGRRYSGCAMRPVNEGRTTDVGEILLSPLGADEEAHAPSWSYDGRALYFVLRVPAADGDGGWRASSLNRIGLDGRGADPIFSDPTAPVEAAAVHGASVFLKLRDRRLLRLDLDSRRPVERLETGIAMPETLAVAPDGRTVAFTRMNERLETEIVAGDRVVATLSQGRVFALDFSPDGASLVYDFRRPDGQSDLFVVRLSDLELRVLLREAADPVWYGR